MLFGSLAWWLRATRRLSRTGAMKTCRTWATATALTLLVGCEGPGSKMRVHRDYVTDLDFTTTTRFHASTFAGDKPLRQFGTNNVEGFSDEFIFGVYRDPMEDLGGHHFYLFPDGCFVVEAFCDICQPETVASGRWKLEGNELVISVLSERANVTSGPGGMDWVKERFGAIARLSIFVTERNEFIADTILVSDETIRKGPHVGWRYIQRIQYYRDWPKEQKRLLGK